MGKCSCLLIVCLCGSLLATLRQLSSAASHTTTTLSDNLAFRNLLLLVACQYPCTVTPSSRRSLISKFQIPSFEATTMSNVYFNTLLPGLPVGLSPLAILLPEPVPTVSIQPSDLHFTTPRAMLPWYFLPKVGDQAGLAAAHESLHETSLSFLVHDDAAKRHMQSAGWEPKYGHFAILSVAWDIPCEEVAALVAALHGLTDLVENEAHRDLESAAAAANQPRRLDVEHVSFNWACVMPMSHLLLPPVQHVDVFKGIRYMVEWFRCFRQDRHYHYYTAPHGMRGSRFSVSLQSAFRI
jgi:hypothetical protein